MKRYRVFGFFLDSRPTTLALEIGDDWDEQVKELHRQNRQRTEDELKSQFGSASFDQKLVDFKTFDRIPLSVVSYHTAFHEQCRNAFVQGAYFPAATGLCALGEHILNFLVLNLREQYQGTPGYRGVRGKDSLGNWELMIGALEQWGVLQPKASAAFRSLLALRKDVIHVSPRKTVIDRDIALAAATEMRTILDEQFAVIGSQPWFIPGARGEAYLKREAESNPFVRLVYVPNSVYVGSRHEVDFVDGRWQFKDVDYPDTDVSDQQFLQLRRKYLDSPDVGSAP